MFCPRCGNEIKDESIDICPNCGSEVGTVRMVFTSSASKQAQEIDLEATALQPEPAEPNETSIPAAVSQPKAEFDEVMDSVWPDWKLEKKEIGRGSYGTVYRAVREDFGIKTYSAIKVITVPANETEWETLRSEGIDEERARNYYLNIVREFTDEIRMLQSLKSAKNVVAIEDFKIVERTDRVGWDINIRMELLTPLNAYIGDRNLSEQEVVKLGCDICEALETCEKKNIIHRDIKPENIFVNEFGDFKLGDFGVARKLEQTVVASYKGSPNYMAPEVINGDEYDPRVDIYSLGIVLYRFLNRKKLPFIDSDKTELTPSEREFAWKKRIKGEPFPKPIDASDAVSAVVLKACAYRANNRFATAKDFHEALLEASKKGIVPIAKSNIQWWKNRLFLCAIGLILCGIIVGGVLLAGKNSKKNNTTGTPTDLPTETPTSTPTIELAIAPTVEPTPTMEPPVTPTVEPTIPPIVEPTVTSMIESTVTPDIQPNEEIVMPDIAVGTPIDEAKKIISDAGLKYDVSMAYDTQVAYGCLIKTSPESGTIVKDEDVIVLYVSSGKEMVEVPDVVMKTQKEANGELTDKGFSVKFSDKVYSDDVPKGYVVSQDPKAGVSLEKGTEIVLTISNGKKTINVMLDVNGGNDLPGADCVIEVYNGEKYGTLPTPTRDGYLFIGWYTAKSGGVEITSNTTVTVNVDVTIYAHWEKVVVTVTPIPKVKITYDPNGGTGEPASQKVTKGESFRVSSEEPKKTGYSFVNWKGSDGKDYAAGKQYTITSDVTLKAVWKAKKYTVSYDVNGGTGDFSQKTVSYGDKISVSTPKKNGSTFVYWKGSDGNEYYSGKSYTITQSITLKAVWKENEWTEWDTSTSLMNNPEYEYKTATQYQYRTKEKKSSSNSSEDGWTPVGKEVIPVGAWSSWKKGSKEASDTLEVKTAVVWSYYCFKCSQCGYHMNCHSTPCESCGAWVTEATWKQVYFDKNFNEIKETKSTWNNTLNTYVVRKVYVADNGDIYYAHTDAETDPNASWAKHGDGYCTRELKTTYYYEKWGAYSTWSFDRKSLTEDMEENQRVVYSYRKK